MRFTKMQGIGNDYIYVDCFSERLPGNPAVLARRVSDRHFGVGGDGLILICPPDSCEHDAKMRMFNSDGSESEMCGNGIRCVAKFLYDRKIVRKDRLVIETGRGPLTLDLETTNGTMDRARVNMGRPILEADQIPTTLRGNPPHSDAVEIGGRRFKLTCVSMGNPHAVTYVDELSDDWVLGIGPMVEHSEYFPKRTNVEFVKILAPDRVQMRVWERGSGETLACGTGACAVAVACAIDQRTGRQITVHLRGGNLEIEWSDRDDCVYMTGPATEVFTGEFPD